jgi:predicted DNA-binding transcriptional regulator AlpA
MRPAKNLGEQLNKELASALERVAHCIADRVYSPRIRLLSIKQLQEAIGLAPSTIDRMVAADTFPKPYKFSGKKLWRESTLIAWLDRNDPNHFDSQRSGQR